MMKIPYLSKGLVAVGVLTSVVVSFGGRSVRADDALFEAFAHPPAEAQPFVRWWWNGLRVREDEIQRELDLLRAAGIGGFEINPIAQPPGSTALDDPELAWLSPEWNALVKRTAELARARGMITDIIVGSGWPFGAEFLTPDQMTRKLSATSIALTGPATYRATVAELMAKLRFEHQREWPGAPAPELAFLVLAPDRPDAVTECRDVAGELADGTLELAVPAGKHRLHIGAVRRGFSSVVHGAPGAMGPVLDHYNATAVTAFLDKMSDALNPVFDGRFGGAIRAVFCDSIELSGANWTGDLEAQFQARAGYALRPWLPFVIDFAKPPPVGDDMADAVMRVRYDFSKVLVELFRERFIRTYCGWCRANGALSRYQAYGSPWLLGMLEGFMEADIPETNNWLNSPDVRGHGFRVWSKYASSAAHLTGRRIDSSEAMTNTRGVFEAPLEEIKAADDFNFIMGVDHSVLHGFNYSPLKAGFPGWMRYGTYFSEQNPWWPYFPKWTAYNARLSALFQATRPVVQVAIMVPRADLWSEHGLERYPFHTQPWYAHQLWETLSNCGVSADYVTETVLRNATFEDGCLCYGPMRYPVLILAGVRSIEADSAEALRRFVEAGGTLALIEHVPERSPGFSGADENDRRVREAVTALRAAGARRVVTTGAPPKGAEFLTWTDTLVGRLNVTRSVTFGVPDAEVFQVQRCTGDRNVFFIANAGATRKALAPTFACAGTAWRWDPETGRRQVYPLGERICLEPYESLLLVIEPELAKVKAPPPRRYVPEQGGVVLGGAWQGQFAPAVGDGFSQELPALVDLGRARDARLNTFAGVVIYRKSFDAPAGEMAWLDLGTVHGVSEVTLNGRPLGVRWYGRHAYVLGDALKPGRNELEVRVTTVLFNYARTLKKNEAAFRWIGPKKAAQTVPAGLVGPVRLVADEPRR